MIRVAVQKELWGACGDALRRSTAGDLDLHCVGAESDSRVRIFVGWRLDRALLVNLPRVDLCIVWGHGCEHFDGGALVDRGIRLCRTAHAGPAVAEYVIAQVLQWECRSHSQDAAIRREGWSWEGRGTHVREELSARTLLVLGLGPIGEGVLDLASRLGVRTIGLTRNPSLHCDSRAQVTGGLDDRLQHLPEADYVSLHLPLVSDTRHLVERQFLRRMSNDAVLINSSRGALVDTGALVEELEGGGLRGASLDVFESEPLRPGDPLLATNQTVLTPHSSGMTRQAKARGVAAVLRAIECHLDGRSLPHEISRGAI